MSRYFEDANVEFMTGAYTQCWQSWRYDNVTPAYNKLYYVVDGEFYLKINDAEYQLSCPSQRSTMTMHAR